MRWASLGSGRGTWVRLRRPQLTVRPEHVHSAGHGDPWSSPRPPGDTSKVTRAARASRHARDMAGLECVQTRPVTLHRPTHGKPDRLPHCLAGWCRRVLQLPVTQSSPHTRRRSRNTRHHPCKKKADLSRTAKMNK
ncbi:hypothetical protein E2C01_015391 [Portunus trituberculatus]|uniref:Uncharacterized protein n=1 Tax=Portunus trituberculatus TaxID=210409 RepID=A0A5B7DMM0_PORTR|nr:hypothetical protein [Portunus trituberculatus]